MKIIDWIVARVTEQSTHSAIILAIIVVLASRAGGIDVLGLTKEIAEWLTILAAISAAAKVALPDGKTLVIPPETVKNLETIAHAVEPVGKV